MRTPERGFNNPNRSDWRRETVLSGSVQDVVRVCEMSESTPATKTSKLEPSRLFLLERLRLFTNYWVLPTLFLLMSLLRVLLAYLGDYMDLSVTDLPLTGTLGLFLVYMLVIMRFIVRYVRNIFGLNSATPSPLSALFTNQEVFKKYQEKVQANLFGKEVRFAVCWIIISIVFYTLTELFIAGTFGKPYGTVESPIGLVDYFIATWCLSLSLLF